MSSNPSSVMGQWRVWLMLLATMWANFAPSALAIGTPISPQGSTVFRLEVSPAPSVCIYLYAQADPVMGSDPSGHFSLVELMQAVETVGTLAELSFPGITVAATTTAGDLLLAAGAAASVYNTSRLITDSSFRNERLSSPLGYTLTSLDLLGTSAVAIGAADALASVYRLALASRKLGSAELVPIGGSNTAYRIQGGQLGTNNASKFQFALNDQGNLIMLGEDMVYINIGQRGRAVEFMARRGGTAQVVSFEVTDAFLQELKAAATSWRSSPLPGVPQLVDETVAAGQYGIPKEWYEKLLQNVVPGSVKFSSP